MYLWYISVLSRKAITLVRHALSVKSCQSNRFCCWKSHFTFLVSKQLCHGPNTYLLVDLQYTPQGHVPILGAPDSKVHGANMGPIWGRQGSAAPHVDSMNFAIWGLFENTGMNLLLLLKLVHILSFVFHLYSTKGIRQCYHYANNCAEPNFVIHMTWMLLSHCGLVTPNGDTDLGQHWLR